MRPITELRGKHAGQDIWIIGAGASMQFVAPGFFDGKISIGINSVFRRYRTTYIVAKEISDTAGIPLITSEFRHGNYADGLNPDSNAWAFSHADNGEGRAVDLSVIGTDRIIVSYSTLGSAMHIACEMGAANIILCGVDGGSLDGRLNFDGYYPLAIDATGYRDFLAQHMRQTRTIRDALQSHYGCRIYSLNPFVGLTTDRRKFISAESGFPCRNCGSQRTEQTPLPMFWRCELCGCISSELPYDTARYRQRGYRDHHGLNRADLLESVSFNVDWLNGTPVPERTALDVGCLGGAMIERLTGDGWKCRGWDVDPELASDVITIGDTFRAADIGRQFGAVISREVIEHVPDHRQHLRELANAVMPGGVLQIQTPRPHPDFRDRIAYQDSHLLLLEPESMRLHLQSVGLEVERSHFWPIGQLWQARKSA